ncbi:MAG: hypothetical protein Q4F00_10740 [bacterium]|nr:hypothetical protein [bacterium]
MARMSCRCGHGMGTSNVPSPYRLDIYYQDEVDYALSIDADILVDDLICDWDEKNNCKREYMHRGFPVSYWYCVECQRVYEVHAVPEGHALRLFKRSVSAQKSLSYDNWKRIYVLPDVDVYEAQEAINTSLTLSEYLSNHPSPVYYISADETIVHALDSKTGELLFAYELEDRWPSPAVSVQE